jgi:hypothetical protein
MKLNKILVILASLLTIVISLEVWCYFNNFSNLNISNEAKIKKSNLYPSKVPIHAVKHEITEENYIALKEELEKINGDILSSVITKVVLAGKIVDITLEKETETGFINKAKFTIISPSGNSSTSIITGYLLENARFIDNINNEKKLIRITDFNKGDSIRIEYDRDLLTTWEYSKFNLKIIRNAD